MEYGKDSTQMICSNVFLVLVLAECFAVMPVNNVKAKSVTELYFSWWSIRTMYSCFCIVLVILYNLLVIRWSFSNEIEFDKIGNVGRFFSKTFWNVSFFITVPVIFYTSSSYARICFIILAIKWPALMMQWRKVEKKLPPHETIRQRSELAHKIKMTSIIIMTLSLSKEMMNLYKRSIDRTKLFFDSWTSAKHYINR